MWSGPVPDFVCEEFGCGFANKSSGNQSDGEGANSSVLLRTQHAAGSQASAEDLGRDMGGGKLPEGLQSAPDLVSVVFGHTHPFPRFVPTTQAPWHGSRRIFDGEQELTEEILFFLLCERECL